VTNKRNGLRDLLSLHLRQAAPTRASRVTVVPGLTDKQEIDLYSHFYFITERLNIHLISHNLETNSEITSTILI
jgi:hypothetical protein